MKERILGIINKRIESYRGCLDSVISPETKTYLKASIEELQVLQKIITPMDVYGKWIPAEEPPKESGDYLCYTPHGTVERYKYSKKHNQWNAYDDFSRESNLKNSLEVLAWMPLPEPYHPEQKEEPEWKRKMMKRFEKAD